MTKRVALYTRVSTSDGQTTENQLRDLNIAAERLGWEIVAHYTDEGISGAKGREKRPGLDALLKGIARREFDMVAAWSVCRLGRSLQHLVNLLGDINARGIDLYLHVQAIDTSTPSGKAMFQMLGVFAEFERAMISERVKSGLARSTKKGGRPVSTRIRPRRSGGHSHEVSASTPRPGNSGSASEPFTASNSKWLKPPDLSQAPIRRRCPEAMPESRRRSSSYPVEPQPARSSR
jgi:DNA invertase Pin-like site-specific DNA recombinase